jgi:hypothetical protein
MQSACIATVGILATQVGMYVYYDQQGSLKRFVLENMSALFLYCAAHFGLNLLFFSVLKSVKSSLK